MSSGKSDLLFVICASNIRSRTYTITNLSFYALFKFLGKNVGSEFSKNLNLSSCQVLT